MTKHGVGLTQGEREGLLARASRGSGRAAETRRANLLLAVDRGGFADLRTADREAAMACRSTARTARDPKGRLVGEGSGGVLARKARRGPGNARTGGEAETLRWVSDDLLPEAEGIVLVWDNPDTHSMGSPCEAFPPGEAERLAPASRPVTRPSTGAGRAWRRPGSAAPCGTAFRRASGASARRGASRPPGRRTATHAPARSSGASPSTTPARGSPICIRGSNSKKRKNRY